MLILFHICILILYYANCGHYIIFYKYYMKYDYYNNTNIIMPNVDIIFTYVIMKTMNIIYIYY